MWYYFVDSSESEETRSSSEGDSASEGLREEGQSGSFLLLAWRWLYFTYVCRICTPGLGGRGDGMAFLSGNFNERRKYLVKTPWGAPR